MWLLITFIIIWAISPGPVAVMTLQETRKKGLMAGIAISGGATVTAGIMFLAALVLYMVGTSSILESPDMMIVERIGACGIILVGLFTGYKSLWGSEKAAETTAVDNFARVGFAQGMMVMATYFPQALIFYNLIVPQTVEAQAVIPTISLLGILSVVLIFAAHSLIALAASRTQSLVKSNRFGKLFEISLAALLMGLGLNILF